MDCKQALKDTDDQVNDTQVMPNHCVKSTAGILSLSDWRFELGSWEDTSDMSLGQLAIWMCFGELTPWSGQLAIHTFLMADRPWIGTDSTTWNESKHRSILIVCIFAHHPARNTWLAHERNKCHHRLPSPEITEGTQLDIINQPR